MPYEIVYFDLDHTLLDFDRGEREALVLTLRNFGYSVSQEEIVLYNSINKKWWAYLQNGKFNKDTIVIGRFREFLNEISLKAPVEEVSKMYLEELSVRAYFLPGAEEFLKTLNEMGQRMAGISNGVQRVQRRRSAIVGMERFLEFVVTSEEVGAPKPDPKIFFEAVKRSGVPIGTSVYVGDNLESDYAGALNAGMRFIWYAPDYTIPPPEGLTMRARDYEELILYLK